MRGERQPNLTPREREVLALVRTGLTNEEIAGRLGISHDTAKFHVSQILAKLGVTSRDEAASLALREERGLWQRLGTWGLAIKAALVATAVAVLGGVLLLAWGVVATDSDVTDIIAPDHLVYVSGGGGIEVIDPLSQEVIHTIAMGTEFVVSEDGVTVYVTNGDASGDFRLSVIDTRDWQLLAQASGTKLIGTISPGSSGMTVASDGLLYIHQWELTGGQAELPEGSAPASDHWWSVWNPDEEAFTQTTPHIANCGIAELFPAKDGRLAIFCYSLQSLVFIDQDSNQVVGQVTLSDMPQTCSRERSIADAAEMPDGTIYMVTRGGCIEMIDRRTMNISTAFEVDLPVEWRIPYGLVEAAGDRLYLGVGPGFSSDDLTREVWVIDPLAQARVEVIPLRQSAQSVALSPDRRVMYAAGPETGTLTAIDTETGGEIWTIDDIAQPWVVKSAKRPIG